MNPFLLSSSERRSHWKNFRLQLNGLDMQNKLQAVAEYWSKTPLCSHPAYDLYDATKWPTAWEMLHNNQWCRSSVAIGMENTLRLTGIPADHLKLQLITDALCGTLLVLIIDDSAVLNYNWGFIHAMPLTDHQVIRQWQFAIRDYRLT